MTIHASLSAAGHAVDGPAIRSWERALLWLGVPMCVTGLIATRMGAQWHEGRFAELLVLSLLSLAMAILLRRVLRWRLASGLGAVWLLALAFFVGPLPTLATVLLGLTALSLGDLLDRDSPLALRVACGLALVAGVVGWLLPLPLHYGAVYSVLCLGVLAWRWRSLLRSWDRAAAGWHDAVDAAPRAAAFAILVLGLASTGCWIPTMQWDDVVYHLRLPWQLLEQHRYPLAPGLHIWSMAPWAGDVLQAIPHLIARAEARGSLNMLWIALTAVGVWRIALSLGGAPRAAWFAVALYASVPLTAGLAGGMQTETPTAALLVWLVWVILDSREHDSRRLWIGAALVGGLMALKLAAAALTLGVLPWALWRHRRLVRPGATVIASTIALAIAGSSYSYAAWIAGNPFLPLFNAWFKSPYFDPANFDDARWHAGFDVALPWNLTFHTDRYLEAFAGGGGFMLVALAGAWMLGFLQRRTAATMLIATMLFFVLLVPMQYLRYGFPPMVLLVPVLAVTAFRTEARRAAWLILGVCVLNLAFQANSFWLLRVGLVKMSVLESGRDAPAFRAYTPERSLIAMIRDTRHGNVLALDPARPYVAELGLSGRSISGYDRSLRDSARIADADVEGAAWAALFRRENISDVLVRPAAQTPAQLAGLARVGARRERIEDDVEWWHIPAEAGR